MKLRPDVEQLAQELRNGEDYDDWEFGMEPIPGDHCWRNKKAPIGAFENEIDHQFRQLYCKGVQ